nr:unnamed protein product [Callosobruchus analis]
MKVLSNDSMRPPMRPSHLDRHLKQQQPTLILKTKKFFLLKQALKRMRLNKSGIYHTTIKILNYIKSSALDSRFYALLCEDLDSDHKVLLFHTEVRWLSKGNMVARLHELQEEVIIFLEVKEKHDFLTIFKDDIFQWNLAYLAVIFSALNELNLKL